MPPTPALPGWRSRIVGHGQESPDQLLANPLNWRVHPVPQQVALAEALDHVGWVRDVLVNTRTQHVLDGHLRVTLASRRGEATVPVVYVDLSEDEEKLVLATLDPLAEMAVPDADQLRVLLADVPPQAEGIQNLLRVLAEDAGLAAATTTPGEDADEDEVPITVPPGEPQVYILQASFTSAEALREAVALITRGRRTVPGDTVHFTLPGEDVLTVLRAALGTVA